MAAYKEAISAHLQAIADRGVTQQEIARELGLKKANYVSMVMNSPGTLLSPSRIPALSRLCGLTPLQSVHLWRTRAKDHPNSAMELDIETVDFLIRSIVEAVDAVRAAKGAGHGSR